MFTASPTWNVGFDFRAEDHLESYIWDNSQLPISDSSHRLMYWLLIISHTSEGWKPETNCLPSASDLELGALLYHRARFNTRWAIAVAAGDFTDCSNLYERWSDEIYELIRIKKTQPTLTDRPKHVELPTVPNDHYHPHHQQQQQHAAAASI